MTVLIDETIPLDNLRWGTVNLARLMEETDTRAKKIVTEIDSMGLHLFGGQETEEWIELFLQKNMNGSWMVVSDHVNCPVFARADLFQRVTWNRQSYITITMPGSVRKRYGSAPLLKRMSDGFTFVFVNIHPSNAGESSHSASDRIRQAESCWKHLEDWGVTDFPIIVSGDMNAREMPPEGLPGVFVSHGMVDVLEALGQKPRIDRAFVNGFVPVSAEVNQVSGDVSDHDFGVFVAQPGEVVIPPSKSMLETLNESHGPITKFRINSFELARKAGYASRYTAAVQDWLGLEVTCRWTAIDQKAFDDWRHAQFPKWFDFEYKGPAGPSSITRLMAVAKASGKKTYPLVK